MMYMQIKKIYRTNRRSLALQITPQAEIVVRAPFGFPERKIWDFVNLKSSWILAKKKLLLDQLAERKQLTFDDGEEIHFLGMAYPLKITKSKKIRLSDTIEFPERFLKLPEKHLAHWYRVEANEYIQERCSFFAQKIGTQYASVRISSAKKRLGSCDQSNRLNFSWHLMKSPKDVIDYVVVHELCHIEIKNHSKDFWQEVKAYFPNYQEQKKWIKENFSKLLY